MFGLLLVSGLLGGSNLLNNDVLISIVIPAFQAEETIARAVESALAIPSDAVEVIVVDDGSTDGTSSAIAPIVGRDKRLCLIRQGNLGRSAARNRGVSEASGEWLMFLDSDDCLLPGAYEPLLERAKNSAAPLVIFGMRKSDGNDQFGHRVAWDAYTQTAPLYQMTELPSEDLLVAMIFHERNSFTRNRWMYESNSAWSRLYRREQALRLVAKSEIGFEPFPNNLRFSEDRLFNIAYLKLVGRQRVEFIPQSLYFWDLAKSNTCARVRCDDACSLVPFVGKVRELENAGLLTRQEAAAISSREIFGLFQRAVYVAHFRKDITADPFKLVLNDMGVAQTMSNLPRECAGNSVPWRVVVKLLAAGQVHLAFNLCSAVYGVRKTIKAILTDIGAWPLS